MKWLLGILLLVTLTLGAQQIQRPPVYFSGPIGPGGPFPGFNSGTITLSSDGDYTMACTTSGCDSSAEVIRVTTAAGVSLSAARSIIAPLSPAPFFGFEFIVQNATAGGQSIIVRGTTGTGATIPNGQSQLVFSDGVNYIAVGGASGGGGAGFGNIVPNPFTTIQQAISAGGGPTVVLPGATDRTAYTNPANMRVWNFRQNQFGADSLFFRDVSEWGPIDGASTTCSTTAGSNIVSCSATFTNAAAPAGDVGKLIVIQGAGAGTYGQIGTCNGTCPVTVSSTTGLTAGTPNSYQPITFTDAGDGCPDIDHMPYGHINLGANGLPTGNVDFNNWTGKGCTRVPQTGTIATVGGTVNFTGGQIAPGDLVTTISSVTTANTITVATNAVNTVGGLGTYYGTDAHDAFQAACNAVGTGTFLSHGTLTFSGMALVSHGIDCSAAGLHIMGRAQHGMSSAIIYAGATPNNWMAGNVRATGGSLAAPLVANSYVLNMAQGGAAKLERVHILGNSQAMPYGLLLSFTASPACYGAGGTDCFQSPGSGNFINQMGVIDQVTFGAFWGDPINDLGTKRLQSAIFQAGFTGNNDFWTADHLYAYGCDACFDGVNDQATNWHFGTIQTEYANWGFNATGAYVEMQDYYTEFNRTDLSSSSPYWANGGANAFHIHTYGGESSAMEYQAGLWGGINPSLQIDGAGLGGSQATWGRPDGVTLDFSKFNYGSIVYGGAPRGIALIPTGCAEGGAGSSAGFNIDLYANLSQIQFQPNGGGCTPNGWAGGGYLTLRNATGVTASTMRIPMTSEYGNLLQNNSPTVPTMLEVNRSQAHIGSLNVSSPHWNVAQFGYGQNLLTYCNGAYQTNYNNTPTCGTTTYNYQITCSDSLGNEILPSPVYPGITTSGPYIFTTHGGPATLNATTSWNAMAIWPLEGCAVYNFYGDEGTAGGIGYLTSVPVQLMAQKAIPGLNYPTVTWFDQGQYTKNTSRLPPGTTLSGSISANRITITGLLNASSLATDAQGRIVAGTGGGGGAIVSPFVIPSQDGAQNLTITVPNSGGGNPVLSSSTGTINIAGLFVQNLAGHGVSCLQTDNTGAVTVTGLPCGTGTGGGSTAWSSLTAPTTNLIFSMDTHATVWDFNLYGTGTPADPGVGFIFEDLSTSNPPPTTGFSDTRDLIFLWAQQPNTSPLEILVSTVPGVSTCTVSPPSCGGMKVDGATGNLQFEGNAGIQIPGTTGVVSAGSITSDTSMFSPIYNVCTAAAPCIVPAIAPLNSARKGGTELQAGRSPAPRATGGEPLATFHLHDFSTTPPTNGQVPIFDSASGKYVPGPMAAGPGGGGAPSFPVKAFPAGATYNVTTGDFAACTILYASGTVTRTAQLPSPAPPNGQCIWIINASSGNVVVGHSPETINGTAFAPTINGTTGPITANSVKVTSDGTNYVMSRFPATPSFLGATAWSSITDPSTYLYLHMLNNQTTFNYDWTGSGGSGGTIGILLSDVGVQSSPSYQNIPRTMFKIASKHNDVSPMEVASLNGGFTVDATNGNLAMKPSSKLVGNLQLPITGAASLATDTSGNIIAGTGGGEGPATSLPINALTDATGEGLVSLGLHNIWWSWNSTGSGGGTGGGITFADSMIDEGQYPGGSVVSIYNQGVERNLLDVSSGATPYKGWLVDGYGDLSSQNGATLSAPLRLITSDATGNPVASAASLGTDANGNIVPGSGNAPVYSRIHHLSLQTTSIYFAPPNSPECVPASSSCTMLTPAQDGVYRFTWQIVQTAPGSPASGGNGPCNAGTLTFFIGWIDPDTNVNMQAYAQGRGMNAGALTSNFVMASAANASGLAWIAIPMEFRAKGGSPIQFRLYQSVASNCDTPPQFVFRPRLYGPLPE